MEKLKNILKKSWVIIGILFLLDFFTKLLILLETPFELSLYGNYKEIYPSFFPISSPLPFFNIILVWNNGVSFSMFSSESLIGKIFLVLLSTIITSYIIYLLKQEKNKTNRFAFMLIIAGALGNIFDRIRYGAVIDFLDFYIGSYHWPAFNLADIFICSGVGLIILNTIMTKKK